MGVSTTSLNVSANFVFPEPVGPLSKIFLFKSNNAFASLKTVESEFYKRFSAILKRSPLNKLKLRHGISSSNALVYYSILI